MKIPLSLEKNIKKIPKSLRPNGPGHSPEVAGAKRDGLHLHIGIKYSQVGFHQIPLFLPQGKMLRFVPMKVPWNTLFGGVVIKLL